MPPLVRKRKYQFSGTIPDYYKAYKFMRKARAGAFVIRRRKNPIVVQTQRNRRRRVKRRALNRYRKSIVNNIIFA